MFHAEAHSFQQQARLAITLASVAGFVNVVGVVVCGVAVSHVTGTVSALGREVGQGEWHLLGIAGWLLAWFLLGATVSGLAIGAARARGWRSVYVMPMAIEAFALAAMGVLVAQRGVAAESSSPLATGAFAATQWSLSAIACLAMGLQNATITSISGGVVRTTHLTGVLTDLGIELSRLVAPRGDMPTPPSPATDATRDRTSLHRERLRRLALLASILGSFLFGAGIAAIAMPSLAAWTMLPPVALLLFVIGQDLVRPIVEIETRAGRDSQAASRRDPDRSVDH
ncbi:MAG: YoaK family protein [Phycisphaerales bacterium]